MPSKMLMLLPSDLISDFFSECEFLSSLSEVCRRRSLSPWMPPLRLNPGKHRQMSVFVSLPSSSKSDFLLFSRCRGRRRQHILAI